MRYAIFMSLILSGCATPPQWLANYYDKNDICQTREFASDGTRLKPQGYQQPQGCGGTRATYVVRDYNSGRPLTTITQVK